jgi:signal transduction histidine kinase
MTDPMTETIVPRNIGKAFAGSSGTIAQEVADLALAACKAHSAGVGLLDEGSDPPMLHWVALAGSIAERPAAVLRTFDTRGIDLNGGVMRLVGCPASQSNAIEPTNVFEDGLMSPLRANRLRFGALCVMSHDRFRRFGPDDAKIIASLGTVLSAYCGAVAVQRGLEARLAETRATAALLEKESENKDHCLAIVGHECRGLLAPIANVAALHKRETFDRDAREQASDVIKRQMAGMTRMIDDLLDAERARTGKLELRRSDVELGNLVRDALDNVHCIVAARRHEIVVDLPAKPLYFNADPFWLSRALQNLIVNAAKYTERGGRITVGARQHGPEAVITIADTGNGLAKSDLESIFDLYTQTERSESPRDAEGFGFGLYLVRLIVERHGGDIRATSTGVGCGSEFRIRLPCSWGARLEQLVMRQ